VPSAKLFFDAGSGTLLWTSSAEDRETWGYAVDLERLPISEALRTELLSLVAQYDTSLNWDYPPDPGPWREPRCREFNDAVHRTVGLLRAELGPAWRIADEFRELHADPDGT
jgi:hypothetical protein